MSYLLNRLCAALGLDRRHYNASLPSFDDLVGYPLPGQSGNLRYLQTPATIWGAEAVFFDKISRCRPEVQDKMLSIIHGRKVQGIALARLRYRWSVWVDRLPTVDLPSPEQVETLAVPRDDRLDRQTSASALWEPRGVAHQQFPSRMAASPTLPTIVRYHERLGGLQEPDRDRRLRDQTVSRWRNEQQRGGVRACGKPGGR
jgi:hypothetical protein